MSKLNVGRRSDIQTVILCGGRGTRLREYTEAMPKVLVEVGGRPILWHIMKSYAHYGFDDFVIALGYLGDKIKEFFLDYHGWRGRDLRLILGSKQPPELLGDPGDGWAITFADTGAETNTGGRIRRLERYIDGDTFFATYGDGVADLDLRSLLDFHRRHGRVATMTVVRPNTNFGIVELGTDDRVSQFHEKPQTETWINGGFFVFNRRVFDYLDENSVLEGDPLQRLAADGELVAYRHSGFWACMDTYKDTEQLNDLWRSSRAAWKVWE